MKTLQDGSVDGLPPKPSFHEGDHTEVLLVFVLK